MREHWRIACQQTSDGMITLPTNDLRLLVDNESKATRPQHEVDLHATVIAEYEATRSDEALLREALTDIKDALSGTMTSAESMVSASKAWAIAHHTLAALNPPGAE